MGMFILVCIISFFTICPLLIKRDAIGIASDIANVTEEQLKADEQARQEEENKRQQEAEAARLKREHEKRVLFLRKV